MARFRTQRPKRRWVTYRDVDLTAGAVQNILSLASGQTWTIDGYPFVIAYSGTVTALTLGGGSGLKCSMNANNSYVAMRRSMANTFLNYSVDDDVLIMIRRVTGKLTSAVQLDRLGTYGVVNKEQGTEVLASGVRKADRYTGAYTYQTVVAAGADAPIIAYRRQGRSTRHYYSLQATGWPKVEDLISIGELGIPQDSDDASAAVLTTDTIDLYLAQGNNAGAVTNREVTAYKAMRLE